jgi:tRNA/tmRNA/rRNA uracil-C5-methylase (TrmA/RlmC/RlmD family)
VPGELAVDHSGSPPASAKRSGPSEADGEDPSAAPSLAAAGAVEEVTCTGVAHGGEAVGRLTDGRAVFVPYAIPGERVRVRVTTARRRFARAELLEVLEPSPDRIEPLCPHFGPGRCGGCAWQHIRPQAQADLKARLVREQLAHVGGLTGVEVRPTLRPSVDGEPEGFGYRERATLTAAEDGKLGFLRAGSHSVHPLDRCPLLAGGLQELPGQLGRHPAGAKVRLRRGAGGERLVVLEASASSRTRFYPPADLAWAVVRGSGTVVDGEGEPSVTERIAGVDLHVSAASFFQVHRNGAEMLVRLAGEALGPAEGATLLDLYAGVGLFAATVGAEAAKVVAIESWKPAARDARRNLRSHPDATVLQDDVAKALAGVRGSAAPALGARRSADLLVIDPPRAGAGDAALRRVAGLRPRAIALVSCDPAALARDVRTLTGLGYRAAWVQPVDLFPQTAHIEALTALYPAGAATSE